MGSSSGRSLGLPATTMRDIAIRSLEGCSPAQKLLLFVLNSYCGAHPFCTPSINSLCADTGLGRRTLFEVLRSLRSDPRDPHYPARLRWRHPPQGVLLVKRYPSISKSGKLAWRNQYVLNLGSRSSTVPRFSVGAVADTPGGAVADTSGSAKSGGRGAVVDTSAGAAGATRREIQLREANEDRALPEIWKKTGTPHGKLWGSILEGLISNGLSPNQVYMTFGSSEPLRMDGDTLTVLMPPFWFAWAVTHFHNVLPACVNLISFDPDKVQGEALAPAAKPVPLLKKRRKHAKKN